MGVSGCLCLGSIPALKGLGYSIAGKTATTRQERIHKGNNCIFPLLFLDQGPHIFIAHYCLQITGSAVFVNVRRPLLSVGTIPSPLL